MGHWDLALVVESSEGNLIFDSVVHPDYPELSRMHVDAVLGDVISPLAWTLIGPAYEHSQRRLWRSLGALGGTDDRYLFAVRSGGRLHINVSVLRALSARVVGASPKDVDEELGLTPEHPVTVTWRDRVWYPRSAAGTGWTFGVLGWRVHRQRALVRRTVRNGADLESLSTEQLVARVERLRRDDLATVLLPHHGLRMITKVALDRLHERCEDRDVANGLMADLPDLEATEPSRALLRLAQTLRATGTLDDIALDGFITRFGHRGVNELDPTAPVWAQQRVQLAELVRRMAASATDDTTISRGPGVRAAARSALRERGFGTRAPIAVTAWLARHYAVRGEQSKGDISKYVHEIRRSLEVLKTRAGDRIRPGDISLLSWDELRAVLLDGAVPDVDLVGRHDELVAAGATPVPAATHTAGKKVLRGIGASTGRVQGRAVVVTDPLDPLPDGDILVAHATDTAWTPVFLGMAAVVTDSGQLMSHSSIVARDLGIPAVVGTEHATSVIVTGDRTDVDGDQGVVLVG